MTKNTEYYDKLSEYYDLINFKKDYFKESELIRRNVLKYKKSQGNSLLDVACGTGKHIKYLKDNFECTGIDLSKPALAVAKKDVKGARFINADMRYFDLKKSFDVITCLFSSISFMASNADLIKAIKNFSKHLKHGGVLIVEPWFSNKAYRHGMIDAYSYNSDKIKVIRANYSGLKNRNVSVLDSHFLILEQNKGISHYHTKQELALFDLDTFRSVLKNEGLIIKQINKSLYLKGTYIYTATKSDD